jgi:AbrB family looped-hinge helix DNA binding protein
MPRAKPTTVDRFGRILIPKPLREAAGLHEGTQVEVIREGDGLRLVPREDGVLLKTVKGVLIARGEAAGDLAGAVQRHRQRRLRRLAGLGG